MKKLLTTIALGAFALSLSAQEHQPEKFSPEKFDAELQEYIVKEAELTQQEVADFFPVYKEMQKKMRVLFDRQRDMRKEMPQDEKACQEAIRQHDEIELEMKKIQQTYHNRFLEILPASKVYKILKAEDRFHRRMLRNMGRHGDGPGRNPGQRPGKRPGKKPLRN